MIEDHGVLIFILAVCVGIVGGALAHRYSIRKALSEVARGAAMVGGFIAGFVLTYIVISLLT